MYRDLCRQYYWSEIKKKKHFKDFIRRCFMCQQIKAEHQRPAGIFQPLEVAEWKLEHITMDFVTHLPQTSQKHDAVWVIVDRLTKLAHFLAMRMTFTLEEFCRSYIQEIVKLHGVLVSIISNWDPSFNAHFWESFEKSHRYAIDDEHCFSSTEGQSIREDHPDFRGHATGMHPRS